MTPGAGHYETLGVRPDATADEIRDAYRRLARRYHPDHDPDRASAGAGSMAAINEAYRVLGDSARRATYDAARRNVGSAAMSSPTSARPTGGPVVVEVDRTPARYPWKLVIGMAAVGAGIVLVGAALYEPPGPERPDNLLEPGSCVTIEGNGDAREIVCTGAVDELVVEVLVPIGDRCPDGTAGHRDRQGRGLACVSSVR